MTALFLRMLEMSIMGSVVILITLLSRFLLRKRSKRFIMILWAVVAVRLLLPINIRSTASLFNYLPFQANTIVYTSTYQQKAQSAFEEAEKPEEVARDVELTEVSQQEMPSEGISRKTDLKTIAVSVWIAGMAVLAAYYVVRYILLALRMKDARKIDKRVYESEKVSSPFVFGLLIPKIYLPEVLDNTERECILIHEQAHIRHGDWISKIVGLVVVCVHWFNPLVWLAYVLFTQDIEKRCDESAVEQMDDELKQAYAISIVDFAKKSRNRSYLVTPLGFSQRSIRNVTTTSRVKNILDHKKGTLHTTIVITTAMLLIAATCGLNPVTARIEDLDYYDAQSGLKVVLPDGFQLPVAEELRSIKESSRGHKIVVESVFCRVGETQEDRAWLYFETADTREISPDDEDLTLDEYLSYYVQNEVGDDDTYEIVGEVMLSGRMYSKCKLICNHCDSVMWLYVTRFDEDHYSDILFVSLSGEEAESLETCFVE